MGTHAAPVDLGASLRAVWELRRHEERVAYCLGGWYNVIFGAMTAALFALYGAAFALGLAGPVLRWLWVPPLLAAYVAVAFATRTTLQMPRPALVWRNMAMGTLVFVVLFALLGIAFARGVVSDYGAGVSLVIGAFYVILGLAWLREAGPAVFGAAIASGAVALMLLDLGPWASTAYGIVVTGGGMVASGLWMLLGPGRLRGAPAAPPGEAPEDEPPEMAEVRDTLRRLRGHETRVAAREHALRTYLVAALFGVAGIAAMAAGDTGPPPLGLLGLAGFLLLLGRWREREAAHAG